MGGRSGLICSFESFFVADVVGGSGKFYCMPILCTSIRTQNNTSTMSDRARKGNAQIRDDHLSDS